MNKKLCSVPFRKLSIAVVAIDNLRNGTEQDFFSCCRVKRIVKMPCIDAYKYNMYPIKYY